MKRKKIMLDHIDGKKNRREFADELCKKIVEALISGWSPWTDSEAAKKYTTFDDASYVQMNFTG
ncbi:MAG: hypothetical protein MJZ90_06640 [Bacteroidales bacterium]|nr:hypothetical protein [Bacteroidales bacterium]